MNDGVCSQCLGFVVQFDRRRQPLQEKKLSTRHETRLEDPAPYLGEKVAAGPLMAVDEMAARIHLLSSEMDANDEENAQYQAEIDQLYAAIDAVNLKSSTKK